MYYIYKYIYIFIYIIKYYYNTKSFFFGVYTAQKKTE